MSLVPGVFRFPALPLFVVRRALLSPTPHSGRSLSRDGAHLACPCYSMSTLQLLCTPIKTPSFSELIRGLLSQHLSKRALDVGDGCGGDCIGNSDNDGEEDAQAYLSTAHNNLRNRSFRQPNQRGFASSC